MKQAAPNPDKRIGCREHGEGFNSSERSSGERLEEAEKHLADKE